MTSVASIKQGTVDKELHDEVMTDKGPTVQSPSWNAGDTASAMNVGKDRNSLHGSPSHDAPKGHEKHIAEHGVVHSPSGNDFTHKGGRSKYD